MKSPFFGECFDSRSFGAPVTASRSETDLLPTYVATGGSNDNGARWPNVSLCRPPRVAPDHVGSGATPGLCFAALFFAEPASTSAVSALGLVLRGRPVAFGEEEREQYGSECLGV